MPADVDPGAGGHLARCLLFEGESLLQGREAQQLLGLDEQLGGEGWATQEEELSEVQLEACEALLGEMPPLRASVLHRLLAKVLPASEQPLHAAVPVVCWLLAPVVLGMRPEVLSGLVDAWAAVHLLLENARASAGAGAGAAGGDSERTMLAQRAVCGQGELV